MFPQSATVPGTLKPKRPLRRPCAGTPRYYPVSMRHPSEVTRATAIAIEGADARPASAQTGVLSAGNEVQTSQRGEWVKVEEVK